MIATPKEILLSVFPEEEITDYLLHRASLVQEQFQRLSAHRLISLEDDIIGKNILDWECGTAAHASLFVFSGAKHVVATDSYPMWENTQIFSIAQNQFTYLGRSLPHALEELPKNMLFDLCFSNTSSEHIPVEILEQSLQLIHQQLTKGGILFINHDNYYSPMGAHDVAVMHSKENYKTIIPKGEDCWNDGFCPSSKETREYLGSQIYHPTDLDSPPESLDISIGDYARCTDCPYYKRSQLWAHLLYPDEFDSLFGTWHRDCLNKITIQELRAILDRCGFDILLEHPLIISNIPPATLLATYGEENLTTTTLKMRCVAR